MDSLSATQNGQVAAESLSALHELNPYCQATPTKLRLALAT